jgi:hypothetical protein
VDNPVPDVIRQVIRAKAEALEQCAREVEQPEELARPDLARKWRGEAAQYRVAVGELEL